MNRIPGSGASLTARARGLVCLLLMVGQGLSAQTLPVRLFTSADGLAHDRVKCVVGDEQGFLWLCTGFGLNHFDGRRFVSYGVDDGLPHASVNDLLVSTDGTYWAATNGGGVASLRPLEADGPLFVHSPIGGSAPGSERVNDLFEDRAGSLWAGTDGGLFEMRPAGREASFRAVELAPERAGEVVQVWTFAESEGESLWIGSSRGLFERDSTGGMRQHRIRPGRSSDHVWAIHVDRQGRLWIGHDRGLVVWWPGEQQGAAPPGPGEVLPTCWTEAGAGPRPEGLPDRPGAACRWMLPEAPEAFRVRSFLGRSSGGIWFAGNGGIARVGDEGLQLYREELGHPTIAAQALAEDPAGNLWFGTDFHGAGRLASHGFVGFGPGDGLAQAPVLSIQKGSADEIFAVSARLWIHRVGDGNIDAVRMNLPDSEGDETRLSSYARRGSDGVWWVPTREGLYRFPEVDEIEELAGREPLGPWTRDHGLHGDDTWRVFPDSGGDLWISTRLPGREVLTRWERSTGTFHRYSDRDGLPAFNPPMSFWESPEGDVWLGFWEGGVARYRDGRFDFFDGSNGIPRGHVLAWSGGPDGRLFLGGYGGVAEVVDRSAPFPRFRPVTGTEGVLGVSSLVFDGEHSLYVGTVHGLDRLDLDTGGRQRFTTADGLAANGVRDLLRDGRGRLWIATSGGLSRLGPGPAPSGLLPEALITGIRVDGEAVPLPPLGIREAGPFRFRNRPSRVQVDLTALGHEIGGASRFRLLTKNETGGALLSTSEPSLVLSLPSPGRHELRIEAVDALGRTSRQPATVTFTVPPPWWLRPWFLALAAVLLAGSLTVAHRLRVRRLLEIEQVRTRIAGDLHDDLGGHLTRLSVLSEVARNEVHLAPDRAARRLSEIGDDARGMIDAMSDIVWSIAPGHDRLEDLAAKVRRTVAELLEGTGIRWRVELDGGDLTLRPEQRRHLLLVTKEALHNAVRHAEPTRVSVRLAHRSGTLTLEVRDDGRGFTVSRDTAERGFRDGHGLASLQTRAEGLGAELEIQSRPGRGTLVRLAVPLGRKRRGA